MVCSHQIQTRPQEGTADAFCSEESIPSPCFTPLCFSITLHFSSPVLKLFTAVTGSVRARRTWLCLLHALGSSSRS